MIELHDFAKFLLKTDFVPSGREKFYVHWVRNFLEFSLRYKQLAWNEQLNLFLKHLGIATHIQDWQIRQADHAVRLYFINFKNTPPPEQIAAELKKPERISDKQLSARFREDLQLRNYSPRTIKTYTSWVARYLTYCQDKQPLHNGYQSDIPNSVRDFLAYFAIKEKISSTSQNQAFNSLLTYFRICHNLDLGNMKDCVRSRQGSRLPGSLTCMIVTLPKDFARSGSPMPLTPNIRTPKRARHGSTFFHQAPFLSIPIPIRPGVTT